MPTVILLDFWGVIGIVQTDADLAGMAARLRVPASDFTQAYWRHREFYDAGGTRAAYWQRVADDLAVPLDAPVVTDLGDLDVRSWSRVDPEMLTLIGQLRDRGHRLALLSNAPADLVGHASSVLAGLVPELLFSSQLGLAKPDRRIFEVAADRLGVTADQVLFVDDNPLNTTTATAFGMQALLHTSVPATRQALVSAGIAV